MARPHRIQLQNAHYLIQFEGSEGMGLFTEESDCDHFLTLMEISALKHNVNILAYALAGNRAELLIHTPRGNVSAFTQGLQTGFARHLHHHYVHQGPVMNGRYKSKLVEPGATLAATAAWIHALPAREGLKKSAYTSLGGYLQPTNAPAFLNTAPVLKALGGRVDSRAERFKNLCEEFAANPDQEAAKPFSASPVAIGSPAFLEEIRNLHEAVRKGKGGKTIRLHGRSKRGIAQAKIIDAVAGEFSLDPKDLKKRPRGDMGRPALAYFLYNHGERSQSEIAGLLGLTSAAAVSLQIRRLLEARAQNPALDKQLDRVERKLDKLS
jgi:putative transposase